MKNLRLKAARAAKDLSQQELAERVGVSRQTVNAIEKGDYNPTIRLCTAICRELGKTLDELFWEDFILLIKSYFNNKSSEIRRKITGSPKEFKIERILIVIE